MQFKHQAIVWKRFTMGRRRESSQYHVIDMQKYVMTRWLVDYIYTGAQTQTTARHSVANHTFEGENFREFHGFVAIRESFLREIWRRGTSARSSSFLPWKFSIPHFAFSKAAKQGDAWVWGSRTSHWARAAQLACILVSQASRIFLYFRNRENCGWPARLLASMQANLGVVFLIVALAQARVDPTKVLFYKESSKASLYSGPSTIAGATIFERTC